MLLKTVLTKESKAHGLQKEYKVHKYLQHGLVQVHYYQNNF